MTVSLIAYFELYCRFSLAAGVLFALVCFLDWLCDFLKVNFQNRDKEVQT